MKIVKHAFSLCLMALVIYSCSQDDDSTDFVDNIAAPTNVSANVVVTQDNTGLVTITPLGEGVITFNITFGDGEVAPDVIQPGNSVSHIYEEGTYEATITANGLNGLTTTATQSIVVSFQAPQNLVVSIENDTAISKQVNVTASADFAISYEVDFGETGTSPIMGNIDEQVSFIYQEPGTYTITVTAFSAAVETTTYTEEFVVTEILQPVTAAPTPNRPAANVIAIYSDAYTPITTTEFPTSWSNSGFAEIQIEGNNTINYSNLAFTGIVTDYDNPTNLNTMDFVHFDYWTTDASTLSFKIVNTALDPAQEDIESAGTITTGEWVSVDIPLDDFNLDRSQITQLLFDTLGNTATVFIDNLYFYIDAPTMPLVAAPTPTIDAGNVISIYSDAYTSITVTEFPTEWSNSGFEEIQIEGNNTISYSDLAFTGIVTDYDNPTDLTGVDFVHFDYWTPNASTLGLKIVNTVIGEEDIESLATIELGAWVSVDIPLNDYAIDRSQVTQILFDALGNTADVYIDNLFFYGALPSEPSEAAPTPIVPEANVISLFSDAYTDVTVDTWNTGWSDAIFEDVTVDGNATKKYSNLNFNGIETVGSPIDASGMTHIHLDIWTPDITAFRVKMVDFLGDGFAGSNGDTEAELSFAPAFSGWVSLEIPLSDFSAGGMSSFSDINQFIISGDPSGSGTVYIDNVYFHN